MNVMPPNAVAVWHMNDENDAAGTFPLAIQGAGVVRNPRMVRKLIRVKSADLAAEQGAGAPGILGPISVPLVGRCRFRQENEKVGRFLARPA